MNRGLMGAFAGIGEGISEAGQMMGQNYLEEKRLALQARIRGEERAEEQAFQKEMTQDERQYQKGLLADERQYKDSNRPSYEDVTDESGNLIAQRNAENNKYTPFTTRAGSTDMPERQRMVVENWYDELSDLREMQADPVNELSEDQLVRMNTLQLNLRNFESGEAPYSVLNDALSGKLPEGGGGQGAPDPQGKPEKKPAGLIERVRANMEQQNQAKAESSVEQKIDALEDEADEVLDRLRPEIVRGPMGRPDGNRRPEVDPQAMAEAQEMVQRLLTIQSDPEMADNLSPRQLNKLEQRIMDFQRAGVPINLDPKQ